MRMLLLALCLVALPLTASAQLLRVAPRPAVQQPAPLRVEDATTRVMLETTQSAQNDLQTLMGAMQATNSRKQQLRAVRAQNPRAIQDAPASAAVVAVANPCAGQNVTAWRTCFDRVHAKLVGVPMGSVEKAEIDQQVGALKQDLDSMSEMGEMESLRLQMAMDRMSKMMSTLSNVMKKASDTSSTIIQNIK